MDGVLPPLARRIREDVGKDFGPDLVAHDLGHLDRVWRLARTIRAEEGGDLEVIGAAAYLHDLHRLAEHQGAPAEDPRALVRAVLARAGARQATVEPVLACVAAVGRHTFAGHELGALSPEARIVRDADQLDALGAVGLARAFMFGGRLGEPLWIEGVEPAAVYAPGRATSVVHHVREKLLRLREDMLTEPGRALAEERHAYTAGFLERLEREWAAG